MESSRTKPEAAPKPTPGAGSPRPPEPVTARRAEHPEAARPGESVTAYDHLWFERRPIA